jgi:hypothetical protein
MARLPEAWPVCPNHGPPARIMARLPEAWPTCPKAAPTARQLSMNAIREREPLSAYHRRSLRSVIVAASTRKAPAHALLKIQLRQNQIKFFLKILIQLIRSHIDIPYGYFNLI